MPYRKYGNRRVEYDGFVFDSRLESLRYQELVLFERAGEIKDLELQPKFSLDVNGHHIANYYADFRYLDCKTGQIVVEDVKGMRTKEYRLKKKLVEAIYGMTVVEVTKRG